MTGEIARHTTANTLTLITRALDSGKTVPLKRILKTSSRRLRVLMNEFGESSSTASSTPYQYLEDIATSDAAFKPGGDTLEEMFLATSDATMNVMVENLDGLPIKNGE